MAFAPLLAEETTATGLVVHPFWCSSRSSIPRHLFLLRGYFGGDLTVLANRAEKIREGLRGEAARAEREKMKAEGADARRRASRSAGDLERRPRPPRRPADLRTQAKTRRIASRTCAKTRNPHDQAPRSSARSLRAWSF